MLTRLRAQGFKNLLDVEVRFGPFTCIAGVNGVGKSNLFDAIRFLHLLTGHPIAEAARLLRESRGRAPRPRSLFTTFGDFRAPRIRLTADLVLERRAVDEFGVEAEAAISTVRYAVAFRLDDSDRAERLELVEESLEAIPLSEARSGLGFPAAGAFKDSAITGRRAAPLISTVAARDGAEIRIHQEGHSGKRVPAGRATRTALGGLASADFPTLLAAHREMASWRTLLLEPSAMRAPSSHRDPRRIDGRGGNLPAALERLRQGEGAGVYAGLTRRLAELLDDVRGVRVVDDEAAETLTLEVAGADGVYHPAESLSDGTLRFLVLAALGADPESRGLICLEEPENGIHPSRIPAMVRLLKELAVDSGEPVGAGNPPRQVVVNTHAPVVLQTIDADDLVYMEPQQVTRQGSRGRVAYVRVPPRSWRAKVGAATRRLGPGHLVPYWPPAEREEPQLWLDFPGEGS